jgi:Zn-dependent metalloprotease
MRVILLISSSLAFALQFIPGCDCASSLPKRGHHQHQSQINLHHTIHQEHQKSHIPFHFPRAVVENRKTPPRNLGKGQQWSEERTRKFGLDYLMDRLGLTESEIEVTNQYMDTTNLYHIYAMHLVNGIPVKNHQAAVHIKDGQVISFSTSFNTDTHLAKRSDTTIEAPNSVISTSEAAKIASDAYMTPVRDDVPILSEYIQVASGAIAFAHVVQLATDTRSRWYRVDVSATTGKLSELERIYLIVLRPSDCYIGKQGILFK